MLSSSRNSKDARKSGSERAMSKEDVAAIQKDWETREFTEVVKLNLLQIVEFLNKFDTSARYKLSCVNEKLHGLERLLEFCESSVRASHLETVETEGGAAGPTHDA